MRYFDRAEKTDELVLTAIRGNGRALHYAGKNPKLAWVESALKWHGFVDGYSRVNREQVLGLMHVRMEYEYGGCCIPQQYLQFFHRIKRWNKPIV